MICNLKGIALLHVCYGIDIKIHLRVNLIQRNDNLQFEMTARGVSRVQYEKNRVHYEVAGSWQVQREDAYVIWLGIFASQFLLFRGLAQVIIRFQVEFGINLHECILAK